jgi:hypothetical protein
MKSIQKVAIERAEGPSDHFTMKKVTFEGDSAEETANKWLLAISVTAPKTGGYDKTDVWVTLSNGQEFEFRFDVKHISQADSDTDIRAHVRCWFLYCCRPEEIPYIASDLRRLEFARKATTPEEKEKAAKLIELLDADIIKRGKLVCIR